MEALATLVPLSALCGLWTAFVFRRFGVAGTRQTVNRILAHVMELRLFLDEPGLVWNAQCDLLRENLRLLRQIAVPTLITAPLFAVVIWQGGAIYGRAPLPAGEAAVITAQVQDRDAAEIRILPPAGVAVETPGVRVPGRNEVSWRIRPRQAFSGNLQFSAAVEDVEIPWPRAQVLGLSWMIWFCGLSTLAALLSPRMLKAVALSLLVLAPVHAASAAEKTPVILISVDTLRADHLSAYGYKKLRTPNIDAIGDKGTTYLRIDSQIPLTLPSHASLMTSTYPFENQVEANAENVPARAVTLASVLRANGYRTAAFIGSAILDRRYGLNNGFDFYDSPFEAAPGSTPNPYSARVRRDASLVVRAARQWIDGNRNEAFFAFLHFYDLHTPYTLPPVAGLMPNVTGYDAELQHVDEMIGRLRAALLQNGLWNNALVILLADHGESLGDHGETSHGFFIYESTMHVPLLIHWPDGSAQYPERIAEPGGLIDVAPTILDFLHIAAPPSFRGASLLPGHAEHRPWGESVYPKDNFGWAALRSLVSGPYKYIDAPKPELYDLVKDPAERVNVLRAYPDVARDIKTRIGELAARLTPKQISINPDISPHTREVLGSLGYTAGGRPAAQTPGADPKDKIAEQEAFEGALALLYSGQYPGAIGALYRIVAQDARNLPALSALGEANLRLGNAAEAVRVWQQALERDPQYRPAAQSLGEYWLSQKNYEKACRFLPTAEGCRNR